MNENYEALLLKVRARIGQGGGHLELTRDERGWTWRDTHRPQAAERRFASWSDALEHADSYTSLWYASA